MCPIFQILDLIICDMIYEYKTPCAFENYGMLINLIKLSSSASFFWQSGIHSMKSAFNQTGKWKLHDERWHGSRFSNYWKEVYLEEIIETILADTLIKANGTAAIDISKCLIKFTPTYLIIMSMLLSELTISPS